ncbi:MAG: hypothetical protein ACR2NN_02775 [Bryobacteraceae bacterium]
MNAAILIAFSAGLTVAIDQKRIGSIRHEAATASVWSDWNTVNLALRMGPNGPNWTYDRQDDPARVRLIDRLRGIYMLADEQGRVLQWSTLYQHLSIVPRLPVAQDPHFWEVKGKGIMAGTYLLYTAPIRFSGGRVYQLTVARPI